MSKTIKRTIVMTRATVLGINTESRCEERREITLPGDKGDREILKEIADATFKPALVEYAETIRKRYQMEVETFIKNAEEI